MALNVFRYFSFFVLMIKRNLCCHIRTVVRKLIYRPFIPHLTVQVRLRIARAALSLPPSVLISLLHANYRESRMRTFTSVYSWGFLTFIASLPPFEGKCSHEIFLVLLLVASL